MIGVRKLPKGQKPDRLSRRMILFIILGTLPLFLILPVKDYVEGLYQNPIFIGCAFLGTGLILFLSDRLSGAARRLRMPPLSMCSWWAAARPWPRSPVFPAPAPPSPWAWPGASAGSSP